MLNNWAISLSNESRNQTYSLVTSDNVLFDISKISRANFPTVISTPAFSSCHYGVSILIVNTWGCHISDGSLCYIGHESHDGENDKASEHAGEGVDAADNDRISVGERQSTRQPLSLLYQFLINLSHIVERCRGKGWWRAILNPAAEQQLNTFILTCAFKMAESASSFKPVGTV